MNYPGPQYPGYPQQPQAPVQQPQYPGYPPQAPQQYAPPQQFPQQGYQQPPQQPSAPLATGSIDDYYGQPSAGGGPSISWKDKPIGYAYVGIVTRDVTDADIQQQTDPQTKQPKFYRDGRPQFVMKVPLQIQPQDAVQQQAFPEGEGTLFVRGQMRDELVRAMKEAGVTGAPKAGSAIVVQLAGKRNTGAIPANQFSIRYQPAAGEVAAQPQPPVQQAPVEQPQQFQPPAQQPVQQVEQPQYAQPAQQFQPVPQPTAQPQFQQPIAQASQQPIQQQAPAQPAAPQAPADFNAEQQALLSRLTGQNPAA